MLMAHAGTAEKTDHTNIGITFLSSLSTIYHTPDCYLRYPNPLYFTRRRLNALPPYVPDYSLQKNTIATRLETRMGISAAWR